MATKYQQPDTAESEIPSGDQTVTKPRMILFAGRGARGKSFLTRLLVQYFLAKHLQIIIVDGDRLNPTTKTYFPDAMTPAEADEELYVRWIKTLFSLPIEKQKTVIIDLGASADNALKRIFYERDVVKFCLRNGVIPILIHCLGADLDDLAAVNAFEAEVSGHGRPVFAPKNTILALNAGVTRTSAHAADAFKPVVLHDDFSKVVTRGARVLTVEYLAQAAEMHRLGLTFRQAMGSDPNENKARFDPFQQFEISEWYESMTKQLDVLGLSD